MDVVYLFYKNGDIQIPFYDYDKALYSKLAKTRLGHWDFFQRQYVVKSEYGNRLINQALTGIPCVEVEKTPETPIIVTSFRYPEQPPVLLDEGSSDRVSADLLSVDLRSVDLLSVNHRADPLKIRHSTPAARPLPNKFSEIWQTKLETELRSQKYSPRTIASYTHHNRALCRHLQKPPEEVTAEDIKHYLAWQNKTLNLTAATMNTALSAFKFFYNKVMKRPIAQEQPRPHQNKRLPIVLSKPEINAVLKGEANLKHRLLLMLAYSSGLRVSEVVTLKRSDIDPTRKTVKVNSGKGQKDRYTLLSTQVIQILKEYYLLHDIKTWLFSGQSPASHLSIRSAQKIFEKALKNAAIEKPASIHSLRHTFATHLLESGTDIRYIQELLGHTSIRTTERYTHVARRQVLHIQSPLDLM
ncbi:hypothetical protein AGMMS50267_10320 [Spirochaetia bacterium]|nr:hypothetical protein AGMMS50267_10320 [Spirochaetia bacterium]